MKIVKPNMAAQMTTTEVAIMRRDEDEAPAASDVPENCPPWLEPGVVTVKVDAANLPRASEAEILYMPVETAGTVKVDATFPELSVVATATYSVPKFMVTVTPGLNPDPEMLIEVPVEPIEELRAIEAVVWGSVPEEAEFEGNEEAPFWVIVNISVARFPAESVAVTG
jgi:hypothetical protein